MKGMPLRLTNGKVVGVLTSKGDARFLVSERNWYRVVGGYSLDKSVVVSIADRCKRIVFANKTTGEETTIPYGRFLSHAIEIEYGYGPKLACPSRYYDEESGSQFEILFPPPIPSNTPSGRYLSGEGLQ